MAEAQATARTAPREAQKPQGFLGKLFTLPFRLLWLLLASLLLSLLFEYIGIAFFWPDEGYKHSQQMFSTELSWLSEHFRRSLMLSSPGQTIGALMHGAYEILFIKSGFLEFSQNAPIKAQGKGIIAGASSLYLAIEHYALASLYVVMTFLVRLSILLLSVPLFVLSILYGLSHGLMRRDLRRFGAGRESSFIYHRAKKLIIPLLVLPWIIYLSAPVTIYPHFVLLPCAFLLGLTVTITAATFKKYL